MPAVYPSREKHTQLKINQLRELTGVKEEYRLLRALDLTDGDLTNAITLLHVENLKKPSTVIEKMPDFTSSSLPRNKSRKISQTMKEIVSENHQMRQSNTINTLVDTPVIDLTSEDADLQRAIRLSMECSSPNLNNHSDLKDYEMQELTETASGGISSATGAKKLLTSNPNLRRRKSPEWPVGLKNVGNTCWFSAAIQSLFNLPIFRHYILNYTPPSSPPPSSVDHRNMSFVQELRCLFALLIGTNQSCVDPSKCLEIFHKFSMREKSLECQQQDVSEFTHKLLDWLEEAFKPDLHEPLENDIYAMDVDEPTFHNKKGRRNPMVELFYGQYKAYGMNNGNSFTKPQTFGLFPLYVEGVKDLHESLEKTTRDMVTQEKEPSRDTVGQELWFTILPPVLIFQLSRFHFNKKSGHTEKIHSALDFPNILYMDRYMESNREKTRICREECSKLCTRLQALKLELKKRRKLTVGEKSYPIQDILYSCVEFASMRRKRYIEDDIRQRDCGSPSKRSKESNRIGDGCTSETAVVVLPTTVAEKKIAEAATVEKYVKEWISEIEEEKEGLRDEINDLQKRLDTMYDDPNLNKHPYVLHAVLVHQGHAIAGHYWAYVKNHRDSRWLKFNDISVTDASGDELIEDSLGGGGGNASAYCLIYIDQKRKELLMGTPNSEKALSANHELQEMIEKHNAQFANDVEEWDIQQAKMLSLDDKQQVQSTIAEDLHNPTQPLSTDCKAFGDSNGSNVPHRRVRNDSLSSWHTSACRDAIKTVAQIYEKEGPEGATNSKECCPSFQACMLAVASIGNTFNMKGPETALLEVVKQEWKRLKQLSQQSSDMTYDPRLQHIAVYMFKNHASRKLIERAILEQFADDQMSYDQRSTEIMKCAKEKLKNLSPEDLNDKEFKRWNQGYHSFCRAMCFLIRGLELYQGEEYNEALPYLASVRMANDEVAAESGDWQSLDFFADWSLAAKTAAICITKLHETAMEKFRSPDESVASEGISLLSESIVPWVHLMPSKGEHSHAIETIRSDWCNCCENLCAKLGDALQALIDPPTFKETLSAFHTPALIRPQSPQDLCERFRNVMVTAKCN